MGRASCICTCSFVSRVESDLPDTLEIDFERINQVIDNLVTNSVKFSKRNTCVTLAVCRDGDKICFSVIDQGPGIPGNDQARLFQEFGKTSVQPTEGESSTGLGLFIVKRIIELHHGNVLVESELGLGSKFVFSFPISQRADQILH